MKNQLNHQSKIGLLVAMLFALATLIPTSASAEIVEAFVDPVDRTLSTPYHVMEEPGSNDPEDMTIGDIDDALDLASGTPKGALSVSNK